ncbi:hypothetical protein BOX15_Mlig002001g7 [Macrostomum lignano]|uniref:Ras-GAP domain-containing protein n=1 Tax=Macrostomum lignano TaxID=282301 RepID=A0A267DLS7_9PLAT|nr:hypothetical protein BOX15_Mlig002001g7 [Macrostomum lignano]
MTGMPVQQCRIANFSGGSSSSSSSRPAQLQMRRSLSAGRLSRNQALMAEHQRRLQQLQQQQQQQEQQDRRRYPQPGAGRRLISSCMPIGVANANDDSDDADSQREDAENFIINNNINHMAVGNRCFVEFAAGQAAQDGGLRPAQSHESLLMSPAGPQQQQPPQSQQAPQPLPMGPSTEVRGLHQSLMPGLPVGSASFAISNNPDRVNRYFAAQSQEEARRWQDGLRKVSRPDLDNTRHRENSLKLWIFEAKRLQSKKSYFCEISLNQVLYARTSNKEKTSDSDPFWGEAFEFSNLQDISLLTVRVFKTQSERKKKHRGQQQPQILQQQQQHRKNRLVGELNIPTHEILSPTERWFDLAPASSSASSSGSAASSAPAAIRVKARYLSVDVLPLAWYSGLHDCLLRDHCLLAACLEPRLHVRVKEDLASCLVALAHRRGRAHSLVADLVLQELEPATGPAGAIAGIDFRGNSLATKSVEHYLRLVGSRYLRQVLSEPLSMLLRSNDCCEVDPLKVSGPAELAANQRSLCLFAELFWSRVASSLDRLPSDIRRLFACIRQRQRRQQMCDTLVSAGFFLRFVCPAILGPSLFGLCQELPGPRAARALTLIAKTVQNLANGAPFGGKEAYMSFMNRFLADHASSMRQFVRGLTAPPPQSPTPPPPPPAAPPQASLSSSSSSVASTDAASAASAVLVDAGFELAQLHCLLSAALSQMEQAEPGLLARERCLAKVAAHLAEVTRCLRFNCPPQQQQQRPQKQQQQPPPEDWVYSNANEYDSDLQQQQQQQKQQQQKQQARTNRKANSRHQRPPPPTESLPPPPPPLPPAATAAQAAAAAKCSPASVQEDWQRVLEAARAAVTTASTTGSSGYQSCRTAPSPVQFLNPTYQKAGSGHLPTLQSRPSSASSEAAAAADIETAEGAYDIEADDEVGIDDNEAAEEDEEEVPVAASPSPRCSPLPADDVGEEVGDCSDELIDEQRDRQLAVEVAAAAAAYQRQQQASATSTSTSTKASAASTASATSSTAAGQQQQQQPRVRMGVSSVSAYRERKQQQQLQQQPPPSADYESELSQLHLELLHTRQRLEATEARLRLNEQEKLQLIADARQRVGESQAAAAATADPMDSQLQHQQQLQAILDRLNSLECDVRNGQQEC